MNKERRKRLNEALQLVQSAQVIIEECKDEENDYKDSMPENLQGSERYEQAEEACDTLECAYDSCDEVINGLSELM